MGKLRKEATLTSTGGLIQSLQGLSSTEGQRKGEFALQLNRAIQLLLNSGIASPAPWALSPGLGLEASASSPQAFGFGLEFTQPAHPVFRSADGRSWDFVAPRATEEPLLQSVSFSLSLHLYLNIFCFPGHPDTSRSMLLSLSTTVTPSSFTCCQEVTSCHQPQFTHHFIKRNGFSQKNASFTFFPQRNVQDFKRHN